MHYPRRRTAPSAPGRTGATGSPARKRAGRGGSSDSPRSASCLTRRQTVCFPDAARTQRQPGGTPPSARSGASRRRRRSGTAWSPRRGPGPRSSARSSAPRPRTRSAPWSHRARTARERWNHRRGTRSAAVAARHDSALEPVHVQGAALVEGGVDAPDLGEALRREHLARAGRWRRCGRRPSRRRCRRRRRRARGRGRRGSRTGRRRRARAAGGRRSAVAPRSRCEVGSSAIRTGASWARPTAICTRCSSPPESVVRRRSANSCAPVRSSARSTASRSCRVGRCERPDVRRAAERDRLAHGDARGHGRALGDEGAQARDLAAAQLGERRAAPADVARGQLLQPRDGARERRLAGAVRARRPRRSSPAWTVRSAPWRISHVAGAHAHVARLEQRRRGHTASRSSHRKSGTPSTTISGPTGSSIGASTTRASVSPATSSAAPASALAGNHEAVARRPAREPHEVRDHEPDEAEQPGDRGGARRQQRRRDGRAAAGPAAGGRRARPRRRRRARAGRAAASGPTASTNPTAKYGQTTLSDAQPSDVEPAGEPEDRRLHAVAVGDHQRRRGRAEQRADRDPGEDHAPDRTRRARPTSRSRTRSPPRSARRTSAPTGNSAIALGHTSRVSIAPKPAPPVTPITSGEASGFAERALQQRAGDAERRADDDRRDRPRQPQLDDDLPQRALLGLAGQRVPDVRQRHVRPRRTPSKPPRRPASAAAATTTTEAPHGQPVSSSGTCGGRRGSWRRRRG